ncbi:ABC transporter ATP-binding protein [Acuticoccus kandeliae]|uniref:ABC transporter ATP-binding protein n=1 Tax=Acuticoccus kandeliae TaxID=2073160 RepID=UPI000D3E37BA|nr:ABC transporter ATP-binding protein [Acuticoccus kandeliae]
MTDPALRLTAIEKTFGQTRAVAGVDLEIADGEFFTLLGSSGSGKSTLLSIIAGFEMPTTGTVEIAGRDVTRVPAHRRGIGMVFQNYALFPHLSVRDNIAFGLRTMRWRESEVEARVAELLALAHLEPMAARTPSELSGGQQQRVALVRALASRPPLLLLDEPLGALDKRLREHMMTEFRRIHRALGTTMIYVTHDQQEALVMSDRVAVMHDGRLLRIATPADLYNDPRTAFVAGFIGESNLVTGTVADGGVLTGPGDLRIPIAGAAGPVSLSVRPERIVLGDVPADWPSGSGRVIEMVFLGDRVRSVLACGETEFTVQTQNMRGATLPREGDHVRFGWHPDDTVLLSA